MRTLEGRVAVVTGSARGIGRGLAEVLGREGARIVVADVDHQAGVLAAKDLGATGIEAVAMPLDVTDDASVSELASRVIDRFGAVHILCNNAGVAGRFGRTWATPMREWQWIYNVNVFGLVRCLDTFLPILLEQDEAHIVNTGSAACFDALPAFGPYASSKHAVLGISEALKRELVAEKASVGVTVLFPAGIVKSGILDPDRYADPLSGLGAADDAPISEDIRNSFMAGVSEGTSPTACAATVLDAIRHGAFVACEDLTQLAEWGEHAAGIARGAVPTWG